MQAASWQLTQVGRSLKSMHAVNPSACRMISSTGTMSVSASTQHWWIIHSTISIPSLFKCQDHFIPFESLGSEAPNNQHTEHTPQPTNAGLTPQVLSAKGHEEVSLCTKTSHPRHFQSNRLGRTSCDKSKSVELDNMETAKLDKLDNTEKNVETVHTPLQMYERCMPCL